MKITCVWKASSAFPFSPALITDFTLSPRTEIKSQTDWRRNDRMPEQQLSGRESLLWNRGSWGPINIEWRDSPSIHPNGTWWLISSLSLLHPHILCYLSVHVLPSSPPSLQIRGDVIFLQPVAVISTTHGRIIRMKLRVAEHQMSGLMDVIDALQEFKTLLLNVRAALTSSFRQCWLVQSTFTFPKQRHEGSSQLI